jgi:hypothetical protein
MNENVATAVVVSHLWYQEVVACVIILNGEYAEYGELSKTTWRGGRSATRMPISWYILI